MEESVSESLKDSIMRAKNIPLKRVAELQSTVSENTTKLNRLIQQANEAADKDRTDLNTKIDSQISELQNLIDSHKEGGDETFQQLNTELNRRLSDNALELTSRLDSTELDFT